MASVISSVTSSLSGFSPMDDDVESWDFVPSDSGNVNLSHHEMISSFAINPSPSIMSQGSWGIVGSSVQQQRILQTPSPVLQLDANEPSSTPFTDHAAFRDAAAPAGSLSNDKGAGGFDFTSASLGTQQQSPQGQFVIEALQHSQTFANMSQNYLIGGQGAIGFDFAFNHVSFVPDTTIDTMDPQSESLLQHHIPSSMKSGGDASPPWNTVNAAFGPQFNAAAHEQFDPSSRSSIERLTPPSRSSIELSPKSTACHLRLGQKAKTMSKAAAAAGIHVPKGRDRDAAKVRKHPQQKKKKSPSPPPPPPISTSTSTTSGPRPGVNPTFTFCNMGPENWGKGDFDGISDGSRSSQKGRKGALSEGTRANALAVRNKGACFCCHVRKVRCDQQRPCRNCIKVCSQVPQAVCWQFDDFTRALFPAFVRKHFERGEMDRFVADNVESFTLDGVVCPCTVTLSSGPDLTARLVVRASFFTARAPTSDVLQHWFQVLSGGDGTGADVELEVTRAAPIGLDMDAAKWNELRRKVVDYVNRIVEEPAYALQLTDSTRRTGLHRRVLQVVQQYSRRSGSTLVRRALSVYAMHFVLTRHLTLTQQSIEALRPLNPVPGAPAYMTPRLLNRQIKAVTDDLARQEVRALFDEFGRRLKKKSREEWAPCLAAFLALCMLMEAMEAAADVFAVSENEVEMRKRLPAKFKRAHALEVNRGIENLPFRQFAFQFHQIYQTHSRDASARSFNPLADNGLDELGDLDGPAWEMVLSLREMLQTDLTELDSLTKDTLTMNPDGEEHPWPRNVAEDYVGRLWSKFLLSFKNSWYIFGSS